MWPAGHAANGRGVRLKLRLLWPLPKPMFHSPLNGHTLPAVVVLAEVHVLFAGRKNTRVMAGLVIVPKNWRWRRDGTLFLFWKASARGHRG